MLQAPVVGHALCRCQEDVDRGDVERPKEDADDDAYKLDRPEEREAVVFETPRDPGARPHGYKQHGC